MELSLPSDALTFLRPNLGSDLYDAAQDGLIVQLRAGSSTLLQLVRGLETILTSEDEQTRARGILLLAKVVDAAPDVLVNQADVAQLAEFFSARLSDWTSCKGALLGCQALLLRINAGLAGMDDSSATSMLRCFVDNVRVQGMVQSERTYCFKILLYALQGYGRAVVEGGVDMLEALVAASDGEMDPRCLMLVFSAMQELVKTYSELGAASTQKLQQGAEDIFDVLACYFPLVFTPPASDPNAVSREALAASLEATLTASPYFAPFFIPIALEKLSSTLRQAKVDSLSALAAGAERYGAKAMAQHLPGIWQALSREILASASPSPPEGAQEIVKAATTCLRKLVAANGRASRDELIKQVLDDTLLDDLMSCLTNISEESLGRSVLQARAITSIFAGVASGSPTACDAVTTSVMPHLHRLLESEEDSHRAHQRCHGAALGATEGLALASLHMILQGVREGLDDMPPASSESWQPFKAIAGQLLAVVSCQPPSDAVPASVLASAPASDAGTNDVSSNANSEADPPIEPAYTPQQLRQARLRLAGALLSFPPSKQPLAEGGQLEGALDILLVCVSGAHSDAECGDIAVETLTAMAGGGHQGIINGSAIPQLAVAAFPPGTVPGREWCGSVALHALGALAAASASARTSVLSVLSSSALIADLSRQAVNGASSTSPTALSALCHTLVAAVLPACSTPLTGAELGAVAQLATSIMQALAQPQCAALPLGEVIGAAAAAHMATRLSVEPLAQQQIASTAVAVLSVPGVHGLQRGGAATTPETAVSFVETVPASAVLAGLCQETLRHIPELVSMATLCMQLSLQLQDAAAAQVCAIASASIINKSDDAIAQQCLDSVLDGMLTPLLESSQPCTARAVHALGWLTKALAMRGHPRVQECLLRVLQLLGAPERILKAGSQPLSLSTVSDHAGIAASLSAQSVDNQAIEAAAGVYTTVMAGEGDQDISLSKASHAVGKILWQQRFFTQALGPLLDSLQQNMISGRTPPAAQLQGLASLVAAAPRALLKPHFQQLLPWLLEALRSLQDPPPGHPDLLCSLLQLIGEQSRNAQGQRPVEEQLDRVMRPLLQLITCSPSAAVRESVVQTLTALMNLPITALTPYKADVMRCLSAALDDPKRPVRQAAVKCRQGWSML